MYWHWRKWNLHLVQELKLQLRKQAEIMLMRLPTLRKSFLAVETRRFRDESINKRHGDGVDDKFWYLGVNAAGNKQLLQGDTRREYLKTLQSNQYTCHCVIAAVSRLVFSRVLLQETTPPIIRDFGTNSFHLLSSIIPTRVMARKDIYRLIFILLVNIQEPL